MSERVETFDSEIPEGTRPDVCVIGAGIAGLSVALALVQDGLDVLVLDMGPIGGGQTARTSAHLASALDDRFYVLERRFGRTGAKLCYESHAAAIDTIEQNIHALGIDCDFRRVDGYLWVPDGSRRELDREHAAANRAGLAATFVARAPLPFDTGVALRFPHQAEFHPLRYLRGIAKAIVAGGGRICTGVHVTDVKSGTPCEVTTSTGRSFNASAIVDATNMAITSYVDIPLREAAYRTYMLAFDIPRDYLPHALFWDTEDPYHYLRVHSGDGLAAATRDVLLVGGEDHRVGQADPERQFPRLEAWVRGRFPDAGPVVAWWSGQVQEPHDGMAYIGQLPHHDNVYVVTGDSGHGLTHGVVAGLLLPQLIQNRRHPWTKVYAPSRTRWKAPGVFAAEAARSSAPYTDWVRGADVDSIDELRPGHGATLRRGLHVLAVYKDERGQCHVKNARCPHLNAVLHWNEVEKSWDCPAHGSRFDCEGKVLNGPAIGDMMAAPVDIEAPTKAIPEPVVGDQPYPLRSELEPT